MSNKDNTSITLDTEERQQLQHLCREYTMLRKEKGTRIRGWTLKKTRIGPVLNKKFAIMVIDTVSKFKYHLCFKTIPSLFVNGVDKYVTESMQNTKEEDMASVKPIAKARQRQKPTVTLTSVSIPDMDRYQTQRSHDHKCYEVSNDITRLLRHDQSVPRGSEGANHHSDIDRRVQEEQVRRCFAMVT